MARLTVVACGAPLAERVDDVATAATAIGWDVSVGWTEAAANWVPDRVRDAGGGDLRHPDALVVCPLTFNTAGKWALGISDSSVMGALHEALGDGTPVVAVPMVNETLWQHPAWAGTLDRLRGAGVTLMDPATGKAAPLPVPHGSADAITAAFDPEWVTALLP